MLVTRTRRLFPEALATKLTASESGRLPRMSLPLLVAALCLFGVPAFVAGRLMGESAWALLLVPPVALTAIAVTVSDDADWLVGAIFVCLLFTALGVLAGRASAKQTA